MPEANAVADRLRWARQTLTEDETATSAAARQALVAKLAAENFVPPESWQQACWVLQDEARGEPPSVEPPCFVADRRQELTQRISTFAEQFFQLPPAERQAQWQQLALEAGVAPDLSARMKRLHAGLELEVPNDADVEASEVVLQALAAIRVLFVMLPPAAAAARRDFLATAPVDEATLQMAARRLQAKFPDWAALAPEFVAAMAAAGRSAAPAIDTNSYPRVYTRNSASGSAVFPWVAVVIFMISMLRVFGSLPNPSPQPKRQMSQQELKYLREALEYVNTQGGRVPARSPQDRAVEPLEEEAGKRVRRLYGIPDHEPVPFSTPPPSEPAP